MTSRVLEGNRGRSYSKSSQKKSRRSNEGRSPNEKNSRESPRLGKGTVKQFSPKSGRKNRSETLSKAKVNEEESNADHPQVLSPSRQSLNSAAVSQESSRESSPYRRVRSTTPDKKNKTDPSNDVSLLPHSKFTESNEARQLRHQTLKMLADDSIALGKLKNIFLYRRSLR